MPFDGIEYGELPLIRPPQTLAGARAVGDVVRRSLESAYSYARNGAGYMGQLCWSRHPNQVTDAVTGGTATTPTIIAAFSGWLPVWATHVRGELSYLLDANSSSAEIGLNILVDGDQGDTTLKPHENVGGAIAGEDPNEIVPRTTGFEFGLIDATAELTNVTAPGELVDLVIRAGGSNPDEPLNPSIRVRPLVLTMYWISVG